LVGKTRVKALNTWKRALIHIGDYLPRYLTGVFVPVETSSATASSSDDKSASSASAASSGAKSASGTSAAGKGAERKGIISH
jgi:hypothetical protein